MGSLLQHIFELLTTATGTLAYHLVLAFTILGAFQVAVLRLGMKSASARVLRRMLFGLGCLLALQFILFVFSGLAWQGILDGDFWLPPVDRAVILLSLVCILWMWIFPFANLKADLFTSTLVVLILIGVAFGFSWWRGQYPNLGYNSSWADFLAQVVAVVLLFGGSLLLIFHRPPAWLFGLIMFTLFSAGHILHLLLPLSGEQYSGAVRAFQLAAFPFLFVLVQRSSEKATNSSNQQLLDTIPLTGSVSSLETAEENWAALARIIEKRGDTEICRQATIELAQLACAEICLYLEATGDKPLLSILCGYNARSKQAITGISLGNEQLPNISQSYKAETVRVLQAEELNADLATLGHLCQFEFQGDEALLVPGKDTDDQVRGAALIISPISGVVRDVNEQAALTRFMSLVVRYVQREREITELNSQLDQTRHYITQNRQLLMRSEQSASMNNELRLALQEIASLRASLSEWERKTDLNELAPDNQPDFSYLEQISNIVQDIRQPLAVLKDYTGVLLSEQYGVLGEKQQRNLDRIRVSAERISRLVTELVQVVSIQIQLIKLSIQEINLGSMISQAERRISDELRKKEIALTIDQPQQDFVLFSDKQALTTILDQLIRFFIVFTPPHGQLSLAARLEHKDSSPDYALIQWFCDHDISEQIDPSELFSPHWQAGEDLSHNEWSDRSLFEVRSLVEALGGRIWVDIEQGERTIISLILPVIQPTLQRDCGEFEADV